MRSTAERSSSPPGATSTKPGTLWNTRPHSCSPWDRTAREAPASRSAASRRDGTRAAFSSTGSWISLAAPGEDVLGAVSGQSSPAAYPRVALPGARGLYGYASGTSFAAPEVAGAAALVWGVNPLLTARDVARILKETASGHGAWTPELGYGVIDVAAAVARAQGL